MLEPGKLYNTNLNISSSLYLDFQQLKFTQHNREQISSPEFTHGTG